PGMCPGIHRLTFWCGPQTRSPRLAHIAKKRDVCATRGWLWLRERTQPLGTKPECALESTVSQSARLSRIGCVGEYLYGAPVLVPPALPWFGPEREGRKGPPYGAAGETRKTKIRKTNLECVLESTD